MSAPTPTPFLLALVLAAVGLGLAAPPAVAQGIPALTEAARLHSPLRGFYTNSNTFYQSTNFGWSVDLGPDGDRLLVGAPDAVTEPYVGYPQGYDVGGAAVFARDPSTGVWTPTDSLLSPTEFRRNKPDFGQATALGRAFAVVGAPGDPLEPPGDKNVGAAYLYAPDPATGRWTLLQRILSPAPHSGASFGWSVALDEDGRTGDAPGTGATPRLLVGARHGKIADSSVVAPGQAYLYEPEADTGVWALRTALMPPTVVNADRFGYAVALDGDRALVGAPYREMPDGSDGEVGSVYEDAGVAYVFARDPATDTWALEDSLTAPDPFTNDWFGFSVALAGDVVLVGAPLEDYGASATGAVHAFVRTTDQDGAPVWRHEALLLPQVTGFDDGLGWGLAAVARPDGSVLAVAASRGDSYDGLLFAGSATAFVRAPGGASVGAPAWREAAWLRAADPQPSEYAGSAGPPSVAADGTVAMGSFLFDPLRAAEPPVEDRDGAVYVWDVSDAAPVSTEGGPEAERASSEAVSVEGVWPNPSRGRATVAVRLGVDAASVRVVVVDVLGREVRATEAGRLGAGMHRLGVEAEGLPSGTYVVRVEARGDVATAPFTVVR